MSLKNRSVSNEQQDALQIPWAPRTGQYPMNAKMISRYHELISRYHEPQEQDTMDPMNRSVSKEHLGDLQIP